MFDLVGALYAIVGILIIIIPAVILGFIIWVIIELLVGDDPKKIGIFVVVSYLFRKLFK